MATRVNTTQIAVLQAVVARLQAALTLSDLQCFLSVHAEPNATVDQNLWITVSPEMGHFDDDLFAGAGRNAVAENTWAVITIFSEPRLDRTGRDDVLLADPVVGVLSMKHRAINALTGFDPVNGDSNFILMEPMSPTNSPKPLSDRKKIGDVQLWFSTNFTWDIPQAIPATIP